MWWKQSTAVILAAGVLCGCTTIENSIFGLRYGPSPVLVAETVQLSVERQRDVVGAVLAGAHGVARDPATGQLSPWSPSEGDRDGWYKAILVGFNVIDDACMSYIDNLWIMERQKTRNSTILHAAGAAGAALLSAQVTPQTAAALLVLSQAFGFAGILNNAIFDTYLYTQSASTIKRIIRKTTLEYRTDFAAAVLSDNENEITYPVASAGAAYHHLREYLALCLPPTIQAQIDERLLGAKAIPQGSENVRTMPSAKSKARPTSRALILRSGGATRALRPSTSITLE